ncbi:hypothetical protein U1Q18_019541, partial [Sarracenia purpurea var. burkii]
MLMVLGCFPLLPGRARALFSPLFFSLVFFPWSFGSAGALVLLSQKLGWLRFFVAHITASNPYSITAKLLLQLYISHSWLHSCYCGRSFVSKGEAREATSEVVATMDARPCMALSLAAVYAASVIAAADMTAA